MNKHILFTILLVSSVAPILGMHEPYRGRSRKAPLKNFHQAPDTAPCFESPREEKQRPRMYTEQFDEATLAEMKLVLDSAPPRAKQIVKHLQNKNLLQDGAYRSAIFWGPPGTGKTMTALAIAHEMFVTKQWKHRFFASGELMRKDRNATAVALDKLFKEIEADDEPNILIIDEMNELLEYTHSEHHDTGANKVAFIKFFDGRRGKHNFFCIGTMNRIDELAKPVIDRCFKACLEFTPIANTDFRNSIFRTKLTGKFIHIHGDITNDRLNELLQPLGDYTGRNLDTIVSMCKSLFRLEDEESESIVIADDHIAKAVAELVRLQLVSRYNRIEEGDAERQERYHAVQTAQFAAQQELQARLGEASFVTQVSLAVKSAELQSDGRFDQYAANRMVNTHVGNYYRVFPERRHANYRPLPENPEEKTRNPVQAESSICILQ